MTVEVSRHTPAAVGRHKSLDGRLNALAARIHSGLDATSVAILLVDVDAGKTRLIAQAGLGKGAVGLSTRSRAGCQDARSRPASRW